MHLKVFLKLKNPKNSLFWANIFTKKKPKKKKKKQKKQKNKKTKKNPLGCFFLNPGFFQPCPPPRRCL
jgi:hypothetical protein